MIPRTRKVTQAVKPTPGRGRFERLEGAGRPSIFRDKAGGDRVQGVITKVGSQRFEAARARLARLDNREVEQTSDADVIEYLARGDEDTRLYIQARKAAEAAAK